MNKCQCSPGRLARGCAKRNSRLLRRATGQGCRKLLSTRRFHPYMLAINPLQHLDLLF